MEYVTAESYKNYKRVSEPYENKGKMYIKIWEPCSRCGGSGYVQPWGICFKCNGNKGQVKVVRAYTQAEFDKMEETKEKNRQKKEAELIAAAPKKIADMLARNGFNEDGVTYIALGNTYAIKDELKDAGFKFDSVLKWHGPAPRDYNCVALTKDEVFMFNEIGDYHYRDGLADLVQSKIDDASADKLSKYVGSVKDRLRDIEVVLEKKITVDTMFGLSNLYTFRMGTDILTWFSQKNLEIAEGTSVILTGTIKEHREYRGTKQTVLTRCTVKEA